MHAAEFRHFSLSELVADRRDRETLLADLQAAAAREQVLLREKQELSQHHVLLADECEHRLVNSLQLISSLLTLQSRNTTPEAADQLIIAANRVSALGRVHHRLHLLDRQDHVGFDDYLRELCGDLSNLLFQEGGGAAIAVEAVNATIPTTFAVPLGFIVNELITNAAKHAAGRITVRFENRAPDNYALSVSDDGPGLPQGFDPGQSKGLGMTIVATLVQRIAGTLAFAPCESGRGTRFTVCFALPFHAGTSSATASVVPGALGPA